MDHLDNMVVTGCGLLQAVVSLAILAWLVLGQMREDMPRFRAFTKRLGW